MNYKRTPRMPGATWPELEQLLYRIWYSPANSGPGRYDESWSLDACEAGYGLMSFPTEALAQARADELFGPRPAALFTIKIFEGRTYLHVQADKGVDPSDAIAKAISSLEGERLALGLCPYHKARISTVSP